MRMQIKNKEKLIIYYYWLSFSSKLCLVIKKLEKYDYELWQ